MKRLSLIIILLFLVSCTESLSEEDAKKTALLYADSFGKYGSDNKEIMEKNIDVVAIEKKGSDYHINLMISAKVGNETKTGNLTVIINNDNEVKGISTPNSIQKLN